MAIDRLALRVAGAIRELRPERALRPEVVLAARHGDAPVGGRVVWLEHVAVGVRAGGREIEPSVLVKVLPRHDAHAFVPRRRVDRDGHLSTRGNCLIHEDLTRRDG